MSRLPFAVGLALLSVVPRADLRAQEGSTPRASEETIRLPVTRDTWFSNVGAEAEGNNGGSARLKLKSHQEMALVDVDPSPLRGRAIRSATLHLRLAAQRALLRVTVGSFGAEWV